MNEQLIVKNFGPIKDATVDFKRVTVFIGPTGGGKSTLAKLKDIFLYRKNYNIEKIDTLSYPRFDSLEAYDEYGLINYFTTTTFIGFETHNLSVKFSNNEHFLSTDLHTIPPAISIDELRSVLNEVKEYADSQQEGVVDDKTIAITSKLNEVIDRMKTIGTHERVAREFPLSAAPRKPWYFPAERAFISSIEYSWPGLLRDDIGLPKSLLAFANNFSTARQEIQELYVSFLKIKFIHRGGQDLVKTGNTDILFKLYETASGIQSATPMLILLEHLSRDTKQAQSFIIEEPELNLYPTAQQGLLNWLVEKCTKGENDLPITTHSPYILSHLNLLLYAYQVAEQHPERADEVAELVPRESWINPKEFACYQVENGGVTSLVNEDLGLIDDNALDGLSGDAADAFDNLIRLSKGVALK